MSSVPLAAGLCAACGKQCKVLAALVVATHRVPSVGFVPGDSFPTDLLSHRGGCSTSRTLPCWLGALDRLSLPAGVFCAPWQAVNADLAGSAG